MIDASSINIVIYVGVGKIIEEWLFNNGFKIFAMRNINPEMTDIDIVKLANNENAIIITMDKDFGELVYKNHSLHKGILLLRLDDAVAEEKLSVIQNIFPAYLSQIQNSFCVYQNGKFRIRKYSNE